MELSPIIAMLRERFGCSVDGGYYAKVEEWRSWWQGYVPAFHSYQELGVDGRTLSRELFSLRMAKKVCADWASILLNEKTTVTLADPASSLFLQGERGTGGVLGENDFWQCGNALIEKVFAVGTGAFLVRVHGMRRTKDGRVCPDPAARIALDFVEGGAIVPLSAAHGCITEAAFVSEVLERGKPYVYLETHTLEAGEYVIRNEYFCMEHGVPEPKPLPNGMAEVIYTGSERPWFAILKPNQVSNVYDACGMGQSIYANAIDTLKAVDIAFHNFVKDFKLGGKKVFYNKSMLRTTDTGKQITPDDVAQSLFLQIDGDLDFDAKSMVQEFNPSLRVDENKNGVQAQLGYLGFLCGLGTRHYQFSGDGDKIMTATEYAGNRQQLIQHASRHYILIEQALTTLIRSILYIGKTICGQAVDPDTAITVHFEDSYIIDAESERARDRQEVQDGLLAPHEYRMRWRGEDEDTARENIRRMQQPNPQPVENQ